MAGKGWEKHIYPFTRRALLGEIYPQPAPGTRMVEGTRQASDNHKILGRGTEILDASMDAAQYDFLPDDDKLEENNKKAAIARKRYDEAEDLVISFLEKDKSEGLWQGEPQSCTPHGEIWLVGMGCIALSLSYVPNKEIQELIKYQWGSWHALNDMLHDNHYDIYSPATRFDPKIDSDDVTNPYDGPSFAGASHILRVMHGCDRLYDFKKMTKGIPDSNIKRLIDAVPNLYLCVVAAIDLKNKGFFNNLSDQNTKLKYRMLIATNESGHSAYFDVENPVKEMCYKSETIYRPGSPGKRPNSIEEWNSDFPVDKDIDLRKPYDKILITKPFEV